MDLLLGMWDVGLRNTDALDQYTHVGYDDHHCMGIVTVWRRTQEGDEDICKLNAI